MSHNVFTENATCRAMALYHPGYDRLKAKDHRDCGGFIPARRGHFRLYDREDLVALDYQLMLLGEGAKVKNAGPLAQRLRAAMEAHPEADRLTLVTMMNGNRFAAPADALDLVNGYNSGGPMREALTINEVKHENPGWRAGYDPNISTGLVQGSYRRGVDGPDAERAATANGWVADTYTVATARGKHVYYRSPDFEVRNSAGKLAPHVDVRGEGGYVVGAGSTHPDGQLYVALEGPRQPAEAPAALIAALRPTASPRRPTGVGTGAPRPGEVAQLLHELSAAKSGTRNAALNSTAFRVGQLIAAGRVDENAAEISLREVAEDIGLEPNEIDHILPRVIEEGMSQPRNSDGDEPLSQMVMARAWSERHGHGRRHDHTRGQWMRVDPKSGIWSADESRATFNEIGGVIHEIGGGAARYSNAGFVKGTETIAAALPTIATTHDAFDPDKLMLGTPAGPVDLAGRNTMCAQSRRND